MPAEPSLPAGADVVVVGAGMVGVAVAAQLAAEGLEVCVIDRGAPGAGTSSSGEGNVLVSDKLPGADLALALRGASLWHELARRAGPDIEFEPKGGLVVALDAAEMGALSALAEEQRRLGAGVEVLDGDGLRQREPALSPELAGGAFYEQDCQVQPMLAVALFVREIGANGGRTIRGAEVLEAERRPGGAICALHTTRGRLTVGRCVVNAAGPWAAEVAQRLGACIPVRPRRGHVLVTEPLPPLVRHKVYEAGYVGSVHGAGSSWACSSVIEGTRSGTMLLGSSREFVGFSDRPDPAIVAAIAERAIAIVPGLAGARLMRTYVGFRPATPDRLPVIGWDPAVGGLVHATGHEGAGIGLALVTAELVRDTVLGRPTAVDMAPFAADRFLGQPGEDGPGTGPAGDKVGEPGRPIEAPPRRRPAGAAPGSAAAAGPAPAPWPPPPLHFHFDGRPLSAPAGRTVAGALLYNGERAWRVPRTGGQGRGLFCGIGTCFDCLVDLGGEASARACLARLGEGDEVHSSASVGALCLPGELPGRVARARSQVPDNLNVNSEVEVETDVTVIGGGPAGMAAAGAAAGRGAQVVLVDSAPSLGGQYFRQPLAGPDGLPHPPSGPTLPKRFRAVAGDPRTRFLLGHDVWSVSKDGPSFTLRLDDDSATQVRCRSLVLATGASELALPFPGWDLPGAVTAGAAQALLKSQGAVIGRQVVVAGTGPFLLPVAAALAGAGAAVVVVEAASARGAGRGFPNVVGHPGKLWEASGYALALARHGGRLLTGHAVVRCEGDGAVERAVVARLGPGWRLVDGSEKTVPADAVCVSYGFVPRLELARQLGARTIALPDLPAVRVAHDADMRTSVPGLFVAGELAGVAGAEVAELEGELAGHAAASHAGLGDHRSAAARSQLGHRLRKGRAFAALLPELYPLQDGWLTWLDDATTFCRCEQVSWGEVKAAIAAGASSPREVRALSRCGMGYCQGRTCGAPLQLAVAALTGKPLDQVGDLQKRPVAVPVALSKVAASRY